MEKVTVSPPHVHIRRKTEEFILYYVLAGEMHLNEGNRHFVLKPNDWLILDPHMEHYGTKAATCTYFYIHFLHSQMEEQVKNTESLKNELTTKRLTALKTHECDSSENAPSTIIVPKNFHSKPSSTVVSLLHKLRESHHNRLEHFQLMTSSILLELLITLSREFTASLLFSEHSISKSRSTRMIHDLLSYFQNDYASDISGATIGERYDCNFDYLNRMFKRATGTTIFAYLNELRISKAKQMLYDGSIGISEVSEKCGFKDVYYFSKVFKKYTGLTPGIYSKNRRW
jgi:AraC-type DNA-binding domain-containing proteins